MARPTHKSELLSASETKFDSLRQLIASFSAAERIAPIDFGPEFTKKEAHWTRDKNLRDVLIHLYEWHHLLLKWIRANQGGDNRPFLPEPYTWKSYGSMNLEFWHAHQQTDVEDAWQMLQHSHTQVMELIEEFTDEELFEKRHFAWTGTTSLGSYCVSSTSSHYEWALKKLRAHLKRIRA